MKIFLLLQVVFPFLVFAQRPYSPDTSVNGVSLMDWKSFEQKFSNYKLPSYYEYNDAPRLEFINSDKTQKFIVFNCYGGHKNEICTFLVEYRERNDSISSFTTLTNDKIYKTRRGIYLGMTLQEFRKKIGTPIFKSSYKKGELTLTIKLDDFPKNMFLRYHNMPTYVGEYHFMNNKLILFKFGFPNP